MARIRPVHPQRILIFVQRHRVITPIVQPESLFEQTAQDFAPIYQQLLPLPSFAPGRAEPGDHLFGATASNC